jgi:fatty acid-binding protein DegV
MEKVAVVTDTTACVPPELVARYGIEVVPVQLIIDDKSYRDGIDISPAEFYSLLRRAKKIPTTSSSSPSLTWTPSATPA